MPPRPQPPRIQIDDLEDGKEYQDWIYKVNASARRYDLNTFIDNEINGVAQPAFLKQNLYNFTIFKYEY